MKLYLLRHGETVLNQDRIIQGQVPGELSAKGINQAKLVAEYLQEINFDHIYCSDLKRTCDTLLPILDYQKADVTYTEVLRERAFGVFEGVKIDEYMAFMNEQIDDVISYRPEGGESFIDVRDRLKVFLTELLQKHLDETILLSTHGGTIRVALSILLGRPIEEMINLKIENTSISVVELCPETREVIFYKINQTPHLVGSSG